jgi:hypothetical protein
VVRYGDGSAVLAVFRAASTVFAELLTVSVKSFLQPAFMSAS